MSVPSIKGSIFAKVVEDLNKLAMRDCTAKVALAERLTCEEVALLESTISPAAWYSIESYTRMTQLLLDFEGAGELDYLVQRGEASADRMIEAGIYDQFAYLNRTEAGRETDPDARFKAFGRDLRLLATLSSSILNFSVWSHVPDPEYPHRWMLELIEAGDYPDILAHTTVGLMNRMSAQSRGKDDFWQWERVSRDVIRFRMAQDS